MKPTLFHPPFRRAAVGVLLAAAVLAHAQAAAAPRPAMTEEQRAAAAVWGQIDGLRVDLALTNRDLARMACTESQAAGVLSALKAWHAANATALVQTAETLRHARRALKTTQQRIHVGPRDEALIARLPRLESDAAAARDARRRLLDSAASAACVGLSQEARQIREALLARKTRTLTEEQVALLANTRARVATHLEAVRRASASVLPVPAQITEPPDPLTFLPQP